MERFSRSAPKDGELLSEYVYRTFIPDNIILPKMLFVIIWGFVIPNDEVVVRVLLKCYDKAVS